ncbi:MAG TPA: hypothetical protein VK540_29575 [Polyangiaceae bacterium]|nr:hypothetical protein [Polyangiaceae bacterium]
MERTRQSEPWQSRRLLTVMEKLDLLVRFWELRVRYEALGMPLDKQERLELLSLLQLVAAADDAPQLEAIDTSRRGIPVQLTAGSGFLAGELKDLSYDRLIVAAAESLPIGHRTIVYLADAVTGVEYTLPCTVARGRAGSPCLIGLTPDGLPLRAHFTVPSSGLWRSPLGIGRTGKAVEA